MWKYEKKLQYPINIKNPNAALAKVIITQLGGPDGELAASLRYLNQRYTMPQNEVKGILTDIGSEGSRCNEAVKPHDCLVCEGCFSTKSGDTSASFCNKAAQTVGAAGFAAIFDDLRFGVTFWVAFSCFIGCFSFAF